MTRLRFRVDARTGGSRARAAHFHTLHGEVLTPVFMPVATQATVRGLSVEDLQAAGSTVLLANAYHLLLRPGPEVFARLGGSRSPVDRVVRISRDIDVYVTTGVERMSVHALGRATTSGPSRSR